MCSSLSSRSHTCHTPPSDSPASILAQVLPVPLPPSQFNSWICQCIVALVFQIFLTARLNTESIFVCENCDWLTDCLLAEGWPTILKTRSLHFLLSSYVRCKARLGYLKCTYHCTSDCPLITAQLFLIRSSLGGYQDAGSHTASKQPSCTKTKSPLRCLYE